MTTEQQTRCMGVVVGDPRSPNGANRYERCEHPPKYLVTRRHDPNLVTMYCGVHIRAFRAFNASLARTDALLNWEREPSYIITELS